MSDGRNLFLESKRAVLRRAPLTLLWYAGVCCLWAFANPLLAQVWPGRWKGDVDVFEYKGHELCYSKKTVKKKAHLELAYDKSEELYWEMPLFFREPPTSQNGFEWVLFSVKEADNTYQYLLEGKDRTNLSLKRKKAGGKSPERPLKHLKVKGWEWRNLLIKATYNYTESILTLKVSDAGKELDKVEEKLPIKGTFVPVMELNTFFTKRKREKHRYGIPTVSTTQGRVEKLAYTDIEFLEEGKVRIHLNKAVNIEDAKVILDKYTATLKYGASHQELWVDIGARFEPNRTYNFTIQHLKNDRGEVEELSFSVTTENDGGDSTSSSTDSTSTSTDSSSTSTPPPSSSTDKKEKQTQRYMPADLPQSILITELMISPPEDNSPLVGQRYVELYNNSGRDLPLEALSLRYGKKSFPLRERGVFPKNTFLILYPYENAPPRTEAHCLPMEHYPTFASYQFVLQLLVRKREILDELIFSKELYGLGASTKGASLERLSSSEWRRSEDPRGGTPGEFAKMRRFASLSEGAIVVNEIMLTPETTGEKYIEFYNTTDQPIHLEDLYLSYRNLPTAQWKSSLLVSSTTIIPSHGYTVLTPYPEALPRVHEEVDPTTLVEKIDFPPLSPTYTEIELKSRKDNSVIDRAIYRKQWLGDESKDRHKHSLERRASEGDGTQRSSWQKSLKTGTPGRPNSIGAVLSEEPSFWPEDPNITYEQLMTLAPLFPSRLKMSVYSLDGTLLCQDSGASVLDLLRKIQEANAMFPTMILVVRITLDSPNKNLPQLVYAARWLHRTN